MSSGEIGRDMACGGYLHEGGGVVAAGGYVDEARGEDGGHRSNVHPVVGLARHHRHHHITYPHHQISGAWAHLIQQALRQPMKLLGTVAPLAARAATGQCVGQAGVAAVCAVASPLDSSGEVGGEGGGARAPVLIRQREGVDLRRRQKAAEGGQRRQKAAEGARRPHLSPQAAPQIVWQLAQVELDQGGERLRRGGGERAFRRLRGLRVELRGVESVERRLDGRDLLVVGREAEYALRAQTWHSDR